MRFLTCGRGGILIETEGLSTAMRLFRRLSAAVDSATNTASTTDAGSTVLGSTVPGETPRGATGGTSDRTAGIMAGGTADGSAPNPFAVVMQLIPAARTVFVGFDPLRTSRATLVTAIRALHAGHGSSGQSEHGGRTITLPVVYDGEDLDAVAGLLGVTREQVINRHTGHDWSVAFVGFAPGFAYLTGGDPLFDVSRRSTPRLAVPAGAVGLAGTFSGVYPRRSSGGWQLIGTAATPVWDESANPPALLRPGDTVRFRAVRPTAVAVAQAVESEQSLESDRAEQPEQSRQSEASALAAASQSMTSSRPVEPVQSGASFPLSQSAKPTEVAAPYAAQPVATPALEVVHPGILAVFEDDGRHAADMGATGSGAADPPALHLANALAGNAPGTPALELTGGCAAFRAHGDLVLAIAGAPVPVTIQSGAAQSFALSRQEAFLLRNGETVTIGVPTAGLRTYLAVRGGFAVHTTLDSASADTMSGIGPRPLRAGDMLSLAPAPVATHDNDATPNGGPIQGNSPAHGNDFRQASISIPALIRTVAAPEPWPHNLPHGNDVTTLTVIPGPRDDWFTHAGFTTFLTTNWTVTAQSNRVGLRLTGSQPLERVDPHRELASEATVPGAIEVPSSGLPVVFLRDQPVTGGYPVIAVLTPESLDLAGQLPPGAIVRFAVTSSSIHPSTSRANQPAQPHRTEGASR